MSSTGDVATIFNAALAALNVNDVHNAEAGFRRVIRREPTHVPALNLLVVLLMSVGRFADAEPFIASATKLNKRSDVSFYNYGLIARHLNKLQLAYEQFTQALEINPNIRETWNNRGAVLNDLKKFDLALPDFDKAIALDPRYAEAYANKGKSLSHIKHYDEAISAYDKALSIKPDLVEAWIGRGNTCYDLSKYGEAFDAYDRVLVHNPKRAEALLGRGNIFHDLGRYEEALTAYDEAIAADSHSAESWLGRGNVLGDLDRNDEALVAYDKAVSIKPDLEGAWLGRGNIWLNVRRYDDAFAALDKAFDLDRDLANAEGARLSSKLFCCNWSDLEADVSHLLNSVRSGKRTCSPFDLLSIGASPEEQLQCANTWVTKTARFKEIPGPAARSVVNGKIRIGYFSADFRTHPVSYLAAGLFEGHERDRFETYAFSIGPNDNSDLRSRVEKSFDRFFDLHGCSDEEIVNTIKHQNIDILIDLMGHTQRARFGVLAQRPAPVLVSYLGYAGTVGANLVDYIIVDKTVAPDGSKKFFSEKLVRLPGCFMPHDEKGRHISKVPCIRKDHGLPDSGFVFCCFNNAYKIGPGVFRSWMNILRRVDNSVIWLSGLPEVARNNLRKEANKLGVGQDRLIFSRALPTSAEHLARHSLADLFLDTLPYNAHTTASDALWAGLPVLTQIGSTFAGRVAASMLNAIGLPELIASSREQYESIAVEMALDPEKLGRIREKLSRNRLSMPLFDLPLYTKHLEAAYEAIYARSRNGLLPDHIEIQPA